MPMYLIEEEGKKIGVVKALSSSAAIRTALAERFTATNIKTAEEYADLMGEGVPVIEEKTTTDAGDTQGGEENQPQDTPPADDGAQQDEAELQQEGADA